MSETYRVATPAEEAFLETCDKTSVAALAAGLRNDWIIVEAPTGCMIVVANGEKARLLRELLTGDPAATAEKLARENEHLKRHNRGMRRSIRRYRVFIKGIMRAYNRATYTLGGILNGASFGDGRSHRGCEGCALYVRRHWLRQLL